MDYVSRATSEYISGKSNSWGKLAHQQADDAIHWLSSQTHIRPDRIRESSIGEEILALLLQPDSVRHYASLQSAEAIARSITLRVHAAIRVSQLRAT